LNCRCNLTFSFTSLVYFARLRIAKAIGTVVHVYNNNFYEVEFADMKGQTYAILTLPAEKLLLLKHEPEIV